jgi:hypothetical protein
MTSDELVGCLFEPIADYVEAHFRELSDDQLNKFRPLEIRNHGIELSWFGETIRRAVPDLVRYIRTVGPDLVLRDGTEIELKAASDCWPQYMAGAEMLRGWRRKYLNHPDHPSFAGCLFLGDGSNESKIEEIRSISEPAVELRAHRLFQDAVGNRWVLGLLLRADWPGERSASRPMLVMQPHPLNAMQTDKGANKMLHIKHPVIDAELLDLYKTVNPESETKEILETFLVSLLDVFAKARKPLSLRRHEIGYTVDGPNGKGKTKGSHLNY